MAPGFADLPAEMTDPESSAIAVVPVPYDGTSTWKKGADRGPEAIIAASHQVEWYDIPTASEVCRRGIATLDPVACGSDPADVADAVETIVGGVFDRGQLPVVLGGEHSVSIGAFRAAAARFPGLSILQIDAHADTRESYHGSPFNHACVMARARELCPIVQVGIRAIDGEEAPKLDRDRVVWGHQVAADPARGWVDRALAGLTEDVYVTIDLDGFDPALVPATGTPEPGGLDWYDAITLLERVTASRRVVGFDVVELLPTPGQWASEFLAAKLVYRLLSLIFAGR